MTKLKENATKDVCIMVIGNKTDLVDQRQVTTEDGQKFAEKNKIGFLETSAFDSNNVDIAF